MSDYNSSLPVRTENNGDVVVRVGDGTLPSQQLAVNADGSVNITDNSGSLTVDAVDLDIRDLAFATDKVDASGSAVSVTNAAGASAVNIQDGGNSITVDGTVELGATTLAALESITVQNGSGASAVNIQDGGNSITVDAVDLDIRDLTAASDSVKSQIADGSGTYYSATNPVPVTISSNGLGVEINDYNTGAAIVAGASSNHDYTVTALKTLLVTGIKAAASGKMKIEIQFETAAGSGTFVTKFVQFNSTANPNLQPIFPTVISQVAGAKVRIIRTNIDNQSQDVYSTISGQEV